MKNNERGSISLTAIVFVAVFLMIFSGLSNMLTMQKRTEDAQENKTNSFEVAESGLNYYTWHLAHFPTELQDGTAHGGPYQHAFSDGYGNPIGKYSLKVSGTTQCSNLTSVKIISTGWLDSAPDLKTTITAVYTRPTIASFTYITDQNIWFGPDENVWGELHSNGGIKMDGNNDSLVTSQRSTWICPPSLGCGNEVRPGIFGSGSGSALWHFPAFYFDFTGVALNFSTLATLAKNGGVYLPSSTSIAGYSSSLGYHLVFMGDGSIQVYIVKTAYGDSGQTYDGPVVTKYLRISTQSSLYQTLSLPSGCSFLYSESPIWIEGTVKGKIAVVTGDSNNGAGTNNIVLVNNINYSTNDGTDGLLALAQGDINLTYNSPDNIVLHGLFMSANGRFTRDYYAGNIVTSFTLYGAIVNKKTGTNSWESGGHVVSGYRTSNTYFDKTLMDNPPVLTPTIGDWTITKWSQLLPSTINNDTTSPSVPAGLTSTAVSTSEIDLSWSPSVDDISVTGYDIFRNGVQISQTTDTNYSDISLSDSTEYSYSVSAHDEAGNNSLPCASVLATTFDGTPPSAPYNLVATAVSGTAINLSWSASADNVGVTNYYIERCQGTSCSNFTQVGSPAGIAYSDAGLASANTYVYRVRATDAAGNLSSYSATASASVGLILDASTPVAVKSKNQTLTTTSFTPPSGSVLYILFGSEEAITSITDNLGSHLIYTQQKVYGTAGGSDSMVYLYTAPVSSSHSMTVSVTQAANNHYAMLKVLVVNGAKSSAPVGASGGGRGVVGVFSDAYTSTADNSWGWLLTSDKNAKPVPTPGTNQTLYDSYTQSGKNTFSIIERNVITSLAGSSVPLNTTAPTSGAQIAHLYFEMIPQ